MSRASCSSKVGYETWGRAAHAARDLRRKKSAHATAYHCTGCGRFHVGNTIGPQRLSNNLRRQKLARIQERESWS